MKTLKVSGPALRRLRELKAISQVEAAESLGISSSHLCGLEHGKVQPSAPLAGRLASFYGVKLADFTVPADDFVEVAS